MPVLDNRPQTAHHEFVKRAARASKRRNTAGSHRLVPEMPTMSSPLRVLLRVLTVVTLVMASTAVITSAAFADEVEPKVEADTFCSGYPQRYAALVALNGRVLVRYQAAQTALAAQAAAGQPGAAPAAGGPKVRGNSAAHRPASTGLTRALANKIAALTRIQGRLATRSVGLADRVARECGATIAPIAAITPVAGPAPAGAS